MENLAILVSTFDKYAPCWPPCCHGFDKYWPGHPPLYFITNQRQAECGLSLQLGPDLGWSGNMRLALERIPSPYILYTQEDYWIERPVNLAHLQDYLNLLASNQADYIRLAPERGKFKPHPNDARLQIYFGDSPWRTSLHAALWRKSVLAELLVAGENAWQFETQGALRSRKYGDRFLCVRSREYGLYYTSSAVVRGEWRPIAYEYARREGIQVDFAALPQPGFPERQFRQVRRFFKTIRNRFRR